MKRIRKLIVIYFIILVVIGLAYNWYFNFNLYPANRIESMLDVLIGSSIGCTISFYVFTFIGIGGTDE